MRMTQDQKQWAQENLETYRGAIVTVAQREFKRREHYAGIDADDIHADAMRGYLRAVIQFKPERGVPFLAYLRMIVRADILSGLRNRSALKRSQRIAQVTPPKIRRLLDTDRDWLKTQDAQETIRLDCWPLMVNLSSMELISVVGVYLEGMTEKQVGALLGRSESRVSQILSHAIERLRTMAEPCRR